MRTGNTAWAALLILLTAGLAGCIGGEDPAPSMGTYTPRADAAGGGEHAMHGGAGLQKTVDLFHFNASRTEPFEYHETPAGVSLSWALTTGTLTIRVLDGNFKEIANFTTAEADGAFAEALEGGHGIWRINVTGNDATGELALAGGAPAALGLSQSEPIVFDDNLVLDTELREWQWDSMGVAQLQLDAQFVSGTLTFLVLDGAAEEAARFDVEGPQATLTETIEGVPGTWIVKVQTELYSGPLQFALAGAGPADGGA